MVHRTIPSRIKRSIRSYLLLPSLHSARGTGRVTDSAYLFFAAQVHEITTGNHDACFGIYGKGSECITHPSAPHRFSNGHCELSRNFHCKKKAEGKTSTYGSTTSSQQSGSLGVAKTATLMGVAKTATLMEILNSLP